MKITVEVDEGQVGKSVQEVLGTLTAEQKTQVAKEVMLRWLETGFQDKERKAKEAELINEFRSGTKTGYWGSKTDQGIRESWEFINAMKEWRPAGDVMVDMISREMIQNYQSLVKDVVQKDPAFILMRQEVLKIIQDTFPKMVHDAIVNWFTTQMSGLMQNVSVLSRQIPDMNQFQQEMTSRLQSIGFAARG